MRNAKLIVLLLLLSGGLYALTLIASPRPQLPPRTGPALAETKAWGYQLQGAQPNKVPIDADVMVIDYSRDGGGERAWTPAEITAFRTRADGRPRIVLAYMSVGEAEIYRYYWRRHWAWRILGRTFRPAWLGAENKEWRGNYRVQYWDLGWQALFTGTARSLLDRVTELYLPWRKPYLDRVLEAGFDGVYLDRVDAFGEWESRTTAEADMAAFVASISATAKTRKPGALVVVQNGEELLARAPYRRAIDGIAKEDLMFGVRGEEAENDARDVLKSVALLNRARADKLPVFVVEYVTEAGKRARAQRRATELGYVLHFAKRKLNAAPESGL